MQVPDLQRALATAEELGGKTIVPPTSTVGSRRIAQFEEPEGNIIGLVEGYERAVAGLGAWRSRSHPA